MGLFRMEAAMNKDQQNVIKAAAQSTKLERALVKVKKVCLTH